MLSRRTVVSIDKDVFKKIKESEKIFSELMTELQEIDDTDCASMAEFIRGAWANISDFLDFYKVYTSGE